MEIQNWIRGLGFPESLSEFSDLEKEANLNSAIASRIQDPSIGQIVPIQTSDFRISA